MMLDLIHEILCAFGAHQWDISFRPNWHYFEGRGWRLDGQKAICRCKHCGYKKTVLP